MTIRATAFSLGLALAAALPMAGAPCAPPVAPAAIAIPDPARVAAARQMIDAMLPPADRDGIYTGLVNTMMNNMMAGIIEGQQLGPVLEQNPELRTIFARFIERQRQLAVTDLREHMPELMTAQANAYARHFTVDELRQMTEFFALPVGRKFLKETPAVLADPEMAEWQKNVALRSQKRLPSELKTLTDEIVAAKAKESKSHGS